MKSSIIAGIDLAKKIFHIVKVDDAGKMIEKKKVIREEFLSYIATFEKDTLVAMEACSGCHYWAQEISQMGYAVKLLKTKDVNVYAQSRQKNDFNDALAITKAARDPELKNVHAKNTYEQDISFLHKTRRNTIRDRVQKTNSMISTLYEYGYMTALSKLRFCQGCKNEVEVAYEEGYIREDVYGMLLEECDEIFALCAKEKTIDKRIVAQNKQNSKALKLQKIMGIGPINASILSIAPMEGYPEAREFSASIGLVPRQHTSGDQIMLGSITKQGDRYMRTMLIQGARSIAMRAKNAQNPQDKLLIWAQKKFREGKPFNLICVGLANKLARIAYAVIINNTEYHAI